MMTVWKRPFVQGVTFSFLYLVRQELGDLLDTGPGDNTGLTEAEYDVLASFHDALRPIVERLSEAGQR